MTNRVPVSNRLPPLWSGNPEIDRWVEQYLQPWIAQAFEHISLMTPEAEDFIPYVVGSGTQGTYELSTAAGRYYKIGDLVFANIVIVFAGAITGGGTGDLNIGGLPFNKAQATTSSFLPQGVARLSNVDTSTAVDIVASFNNLTAETAVLAIHQTIDNASTTALPISAVAANDSIVVTIVFEAGSRA